MGRYNEELIKAGVLLAGEGLTGPEEGFVVDFDPTRRSVTDGPYTEAKELFNGFWILECPSIRRGQAVGAEVPAGPRRASSRCAGCRSPKEFPQDNEWSRRRKSSGGPSSRAASAATGQRRATGPRQDSG